MKLERHVSSFFLFQQRNISRAHPLSFWISGENFQRMGRVELNSNQEAKLMCLANNDAGNSVFSTEWNFGRRIFLEDILYVPIESVAFSREQVEILDDEIKLREFFVSNLTSEEIRTVEYFSNFLFFHSWKSFLTTKEGRRNFHP